MKSFNICFNIGIFKYDFIFLFRTPVMNNSYTVYDGHNNQVSTST